MLLQNSKLSCSQIKRVKWLNTEYPTEHYSKLKTTQMLEGRSDGSYALLFLSVFYASLRTFHLKSNTVH